VHCFLLPFAYLRCSIFLLPAFALLRFVSATLSFAWCLSATLALAVASSSSRPPRCATFFGPYHHLLGVRESGWLARFEEWMLTSVAARDLEEDLASMDASIGDLTRGSGAMAGKTWDFGRSLVTEKMIKKMEKEGYFSVGRDKLLPVDQIVPSPDEGYAMVFRDYFSCGLRLPSITFLHEVLEEFQL
jgi:hypothetical protein